MDSMDEHGLTAEPPLPGPVRRVSFVGYLAIGISVVATVGLYLFIYAVSSENWSGWVDGLPGHIREVYYSLEGYFYILEYSVPVAIVVDIVAGFFGRANRRAGLVAGLILVSPLVLELLLHVVGPVLYRLGLWTA